MLNIDLKEKIEIVIFCQCDKSILNRKSFLEIANVFSISFTGIFCVMVHVILLCIPFLI